MGSSARFLNGLMIAAGGLFLQHAVAQTTNLPLSVSNEFHYQGAL